MTAECWPTNQKNPPKLEAPQSSSLPGVTHDIAGAGAGIGAADAEASAVVVEAPAGLMMTPPHHGDVIIPMEAKMSGEMTCSAEIDLRAATTGLVTVHAVPCQLLLLLQM